MRLIRATRILLRDERLPRPLRWLAGAALLPIPGPLDEAVLLGVGAVVVVWRRRLLADAWAAASRE